jgi:hypothetical protein
MLAPVCSVSSAMRSLSRSRREPSSSVAVPWRRRVRSEASYGSSEGEVAAEEDRSVGWSGKITGRREDGGECEWDGMRAENARGEIRKNDVCGGGRTRVRGRQESEREKEKRLDENMELTSPSRAEQLGPAGLRVYVLGRLLAAGELGLGGLDPVRVRGAEGLRDPLDLDLHLRHHLVGLVELHLDPPERGFALFWGWGRGGLARWTRLGYGR